MKTDKTPILVITSDNWSQQEYIVFDDDEIIGDCIPNEWVDEVYNELLENYSQGELASNTPDDDSMPNREQVADGMEEDFFSENTDVDEYWPEYGVLRAGDNYYTYTNDGWCSPIDEDDALEILTAVRDQRISEWRDEQHHIANSQIVTPRSENVMEFFGIDETERAELADDTTVLRKYNRSLYVYESQLGEPCQWRLLQNTPHMGTGTLRRPRGA
jgi:hypothetical protein